MSGQTGFGEYRFMGEDKLMGFAPVSNLGWSVGVEVNRNEVLYGLKELQNRFITMSLVFTDKFSHRLCHYFRHQ